MRARCISEKPTPSLIKALGANYREGKTVYPVTLGQEYTVLGIGFWDGVSWFEIAPSLSAILSIPVSLFELTDARLSRHWEARIHDDGAFTLWPPSFYHEHYHYHVSEGHAEAVEDFRYLFNLLESEAAAAQ